MIPVFISMGINLPLYTHDGHESDFLTVTQFMMFMFMVFILSRLIVFLLRPYLYRLHIFSDTKRYVLSAFWGSMLLGWGIVWLFSAAAKDGAHSLF